MTPEAVFCSIRRCLPVVLSSSLFVLHFVGRNFSMLRTISQFSINCVAFNKKVSEELVAE